MSLQLLSHLNGNRNGELKRFIDNCKGNPRIAWYPSAGEDFRSLLYLHPDYAKLQSTDYPMPAPPDIFLFTDYYPWQGSRFLDDRTIYRGNRTTVYVEHIEELPALYLKIDKSIVRFPEGSRATGRAVFMNIRVDSDVLGTIRYPVIYAFAVNETFYCEKIVPNNGKISHIIQVRYGGGCGGGGWSRGTWLRHILKEVECEFFVSDNFSWDSEPDNQVFDFCPSIPSQLNVKLKNLSLSNNQIPRFRGACYLVS